MNDDGEPSGTAGRPIYGQLVSANITNVLVVVVRYFGGTLLGTGGLIQAYRSATSDMLSHATLISQAVLVKYRITFPYEALNAVMRILKEESLTPADPVYGTVCSMIIPVREGLAEKLAGRLTIIPGLVRDSLPTDD